MCATRVESFAFARKKVSELRDADVANYVASVEGDVMCWDVLHGGPEWGGGGLGGRAANSTSCIFPETSSQSLESGSCLAAA